MGVMGMDAKSATLPSVEAGGEDEFELTGAKATARWRQVRRQFYVGAIASTAVAAVAWFLWHRSTSQPLCPCGPPVPG
jgi:hypothetical protein